jgi:endonuclease-3
MTSREIITKTIKLAKKEAGKYQKPYVSSRPDPFNVLIRCILSLRTRDEVTEKVSHRLFLIANTPGAIAKMNLKKLRAIIKSVNFYKTKAKRIHDIASIIRKKYKGKVPGDFDELMKFKGVGRKTANIVMVYGFGKEGLPIDTHCHRIPNRLGWIRTKTPEQTERALRRILPKRLWKSFNDTFVTFGQNVCRPVSPRCETCPVSRYCGHYRKKL